MSDESGVDTPHCPHCGEEFWGPDDLPADPEYMYEAHVLWECKSPDKRERAWLNASPKEKAEVWMTGAEDGAGDYYKVTETPIESMNGQDKKGQQERSTFENDVIVLGVTLAIAVLVTVTNGIETVQRWVSRVR